MKKGANVVGTEAGEDLTGTNSDDWIYGLGGRDRLFGKDGDDRLFGGDGDDFLDGGSGADIMFGGSGNDTYRIDDAGDVVSEESLASVDDGGIDTVQSSIAYTLGRYLENLTLTGTAAIDGTGNDLANRITGNAAANTLTGGGGNDILVGGAGDDTLIGGAGKDTLTGDSGADTFVLGPADATSTDAVTDFTAGDRVGILAGDFGLRAGNGLVWDGAGNFALDPGYFATVAGSSNVQGTAFGHGQFVYNTTTRTLMWDADGAAAGSSGIALATFNSGTVLRPGNIAVIGAPAVVGDISVGDVTITEGDAGTKTATFTVSRTGTAAFTVDFATVDGTARAGSDYVATADTLNFAAGQATQTVSVTINGDTAVEGDETFLLQLTNAGNGGTIAGSQGLGTITNDDAAPVAGDISIGDVTMTEGTGGTQTATFTVSRTGGSAAFSVDFATADGTARAGEDYGQISGTLTFAAGQATQTVSVTINSDTVVEGDETFFVNLSKASAGTIVDAQGQGTLTNDDAAAGVGDISIGDVTVTEGTGGTQTAIFTVSRTGGTAAFSVDFATADGTAKAGEDYGQSSGTLTFAAGQATQTVSVTINSDTVVEGDETFFVNLSKASAGTIVDAQGQGTISNDDAAAGAGDISIGDVTISEGNRGTKTAIFTVTRTGSAAFSVDFATADGTAKAGSDYAATAGTLSFAAGESTKTVSVMINGDKAAEPNETFFLNLSNAANGGVIIDAQGLGTITNDDGGSPAPTEPSVVTVHDLRGIGSTDPAGLAYVPQLETLFLSDSEVEESPFGRVNNLWALGTDGAVKQSFSLTKTFTTEPTGLAFDPVSGHLFISDDDKLKVYWVDPTNPTVKLGEFQTKAIGGYDPEDLAINPNDGHLFIVNGVPHNGGPCTIVEATTAGALVKTITLPGVITDAEALAYDAREDVFYVGGGFSYKIWKVDHSGALLGTIEILNNYRNPLNGGRVSVKDLELAPSSDSHDSADHLSLYVADYGKSHVDDGRLFELNIGDPLWG